MKNKLLKIMLNSAKLLGSKDKFAVYSANNFFNWLRTVFNLSILFILLNILHRMGIVFNKYILYTLSAIVIILSQFFDKKTEAQLFRELYNKNNKKMEIGKGLLGILIILASIALLMLVGIYTVQGYAKI